MSDLAGVEGFTPGPWHVTSNMDVWVEHSQSITDADKDFNGIAHCGDISWPNSDARQREWEANARLIAIAPTMYAELSRLRTALEEIISKDGPQKHSNDVERAYERGIAMCASIAREALRPALEKTDG